jgi:hypothetical protein
VYQRDLTVQAGGHYEVRIHHDVQPMHATEAPAFDAQIMEGYPMMESEMHGQLPINTGELMQVD